MKLRNKFWLSALCVLFALGACSDDETTAPNPAPTYDMTGFAKGADVSWMTEMEKAGKKFYTAEGRDMECMHLMRELGMNAIRLRVWVNPADGWCGKEDVIAKAWRAQKLGFRLMIDFHYSDVWADPANQTKPAAWTDFTLEQLKTAVASHTTEVLTALKEKGIDVEWVQVGNETRTGMLWPEGKASSGNTKNFAELCTSGYDAVKSVYPQAKVIIHLDDGANNSRYTWLFDGLKQNGGKWDVIGLSLYPSWSTTETWQVQNEKCAANMKALIERYGTEVMLCEVGMPWEDSVAAKAFLADIIAKAKAIDGGKCLGVFYWEPQAYGAWKGYDKGAFDDEGKPTEAMDAFK